MKTKRDNRIFRSVIRGGFVHTIAMFTIWNISLKGETMYQTKDFVWYFLCPTALYLISILIGFTIEALERKFKVSDDMFGRIMAFFYVALCCANYLFTRKFTMSFLLFVQPFILILLERRSPRNLTHVVILIGFYEFLQMLPGKLPYEPTTPLPSGANIIFGIYISLRIMFLLRETKDAFAHSFRQKEESEIRVNTYRDFLLKKNQDVREAVHNVKGTAEMILRYNASDVSSGHVVAVMDSCDKIIERVDRILETSRAELLRRKAGRQEDGTVEETANSTNDGTYLYAPNAYILVADDSVEALNLIRVFLARTGIRIDTVLTGGEAIKMISYNYYNLILLDHMFHDMSAVSVKQAMGESYSVNATTPVIILTPGEQDQVRDLYLEEGFADVIGKPFTGQQLERTIEKHLPSRLTSRVREAPAEGGRE
ncbi:MAG: response regulator [Lachnospiraceae bacterium]|nr:response regulator [Lachnospiraceae bacterium]